MKRKFEIEWPDDNGELWMNTSNLLLCLLRTCSNSEFSVRDVTGDGHASTHTEKGGPQDNRTLTIEAIARGWCHEKNCHKTMDTDLAMAIAEEVLKL